MKGDHILHGETVTANGAVTGRRFVTHAGAQATVEGERVLGVAMTDAPDGALVAIAVIGRTVVEAAAAIDPGEDVVTDADGRAIPNPGVGGEIVAGTALTDGIANGTVAIKLK